MKLPYQGKFISKKLIGIIIKNTKSAQISGIGPDETRASVLERGTTGLYTWLAPLFGFFLTHASNRRLSHRLLLSTVLTS